MIVCLLRHAKAEELLPGAEKADADRVLTEPGERKMRRVAAGMSALGLEFEVILSSPYARARQTAEIAAMALGASDRLVFTPNLTTVAEPADIIAEIRRNHSTRAGLLLVGHEPFLGNLASLLLTGSQHLAVTFKKAGLMQLTVADIHCGRCAALDWFLTPRQLAALG